MFGVPYESDEVLTEESTRLYLRSFLIGLRVLDQEGQKLARFTIHDGQLTLVPTQGVALVYVVKPCCDDCKDEKRVEPEQSVTSFLGDLPWHDCCDGCREEHDAH